MIMYIYIYIPFIYNIVLGNGGWGGYNYDLQQHRTQLSRAKRPPRQLRTQLLSNSGQLPADRGQSITKIAKCGPQPVPDVASLANPDPILGSNLGPWAHLGHLLGSPRAEKCNTY